MYKLTGSLLLFVFMACQAPPAQPQKGLYPDIKGYFKQEIKRLGKENPRVEKRVHLNKQNETQTLAGINWEEELALFMESDINKPAFKGLYKLKKEGNEHIYVALEAGLKTREIKITYTPAGKIARIAISNHIKNNLYTSDEFLEYLPDSVYQIVKRQAVLILGTNNYWILGKFKR